MEIISIDVNNIEKEHICCAMSGSAMTNKKTWLKERFKEGLVFKRLNERGKVFIEYIPASNGWEPIDAEGYMLINCLWVSGKFKGQGYSSDLLEECIQDSKALKMKGIVIVSSKKKRGYLSDPKFLEYKGFKVADSASPDFILYYLPFSSDNDIPKIKECAKMGEIESKEMTLYYTDQCPFTSTYIEIMKNVALHHHVTLNIYPLKNKTEAQSAPALHTSFAFFDHGKFVTSEIFSETKFGKYIENRLK